jgi:hypothetical protein
MRKVAIPLISFGFGLGLGAKEKETLVFGYDKVIKMINDGNSGGKESKHQNERTSAKVLLEKSIALMRDAGEFAILSTATVPHKQSNPTLSQFASRKRENGSTDAVVASRMIQPFPVEYNGHGQPVVRKCDVYDAISLYLIPYPFPGFFQYKPPFKKIPTND